jgi:hypothetical protein
MRNLSVLIFLIFVQSVFNLTSCQNKTEAEKKVEIVTKYEI